ncbi:hypothetical protein [Amycolatopsis eburnea]|uniref:Uncharacterized protein n=1 Tax=Amycolatopsis eburnea TaxID=2267691 RepID=A0A427T3U7_9PSEU|nr:hypothetical protein [Amycolatopsis eburnea]RSD13625.1 hypothetical protein EIY87_28420 [Amycolatopsis eburnea]
MIDAPTRAELPLIPWRDLAPYLSVVVIEATADDPALTFGAVVRELRKLPPANSKRRTKLVAADEAAASEHRQLEGLGTLIAAGVDQLAGYINEVGAVPSWLSERTELLNTTYELGLVVRRGNLIAVKPDGPSAERLQRWIDASPRLAQRISPLILECTFLMGRARGLWLQSATGRNARHPDAKTSVGIDLKETLNVFADSGYSLGSARCELPADLELDQLRGTIGATIRSSQLWLKPMSTIGDFLATVGEIFDLIKKVAAEEDSLIEAFPELARDVTDLSEVHGAYDVAAIDVDHLPAADVAGEETYDAASILESAALIVMPDSRSARFKLKIGLDGVEGGVVSVTPKPKPHGFLLDIGQSGSFSRDAIAQPVLDALRSTDLLTVFYESGHVYSRGRITKKNTAIFPFKNWQFRSFAGFDVETEKPFDHRSTEKIHKSIGDPTDTSLFGWVLENFSDGWLICDDGAGESADFLQINAKGTLRFIHVKGAESSSSGRGISAKSYEVVAGQAAKNLVFMEKERLAEHLRSTDAPYKASWVDRVKVGDRREFIEMLLARSEEDAREVVIVQPHVLEKKHKALRALEPGTKPPQDLLRLQRLETLLNSTRSSVVNSNAELWVISSSDK